MQQSRLSSEVAAGFYQETVAMLMARMVAVYKKESEDSSDILRLADRMLIRLSA